MKKIFIKTFGCAQNESDSERVKAFFAEKGDVFVEDWKEADKAVINSCVIRESAENRVYGLIDKIKKFNPKIEIILTGCLVPITKKKITGVDQMLPIKEISFDLEPLRDKKRAALVTISSGCNNYCSYCIVPYARGKEISRKMEDILKEVDEAMEKGFEEVVLIGQNVNSYGADFGDESSVSMGKKRIKSLFPKLLEEVAKRALKKVSFISSNPWDFSDELIEVIAKYPNIDRLLHLPFQSGDDKVLKNMNRGYSKEEYLDLVSKIKKHVPDVRFSTDIIIGFPGEDEKAFQNTVDVCKKVGFEIAYLNKYSPRRGTVSAKLYRDEIPMAEKKRRWNVLNELVNKKSE
ncbi:MAG: (Dimethylallyl)adenosine tRNA methylthiotransferase MiaB [Candidatus Shapirobacteria bacterium GW2011_GWE1_38_10]|uniref:(Dimethylallyl)adenosine tRNA methylthiotransferase MiaB n=1 Tax=Candidatus Shapirobacteria bacterium GW2011_GWE1_38_10 TaxID=1618488 RepID=A0A0G0I494_9BACT|nr:MAG: (Dimethylallyl)adenosine tRNA methylthiotransferase MiaB [Candidatus Shapirobacteria bacterium GW2011_GWF2_37_20]KKQ50123.1 MAG: (Dimethylallyl)adenosine tRNA methylthiotransferase MiaB [Candidatus Shapirobacteria bacterium GW2011_GWE1_38_10]KKQ63940.1 MAG: (Dimethylallyl)adenosine tRNA methylthiotransferase MiaB [Candidatus Shapirobacteria bacterium GW2011_GWF1_38_23]HBP51477.1 tRNA (N6-isopentenyl adenosine(37)-C2)-methylthiotransferase MiaB [Candidatus Shapirobacteria bacterium]